MWNRNAQWTWGWLGLISKSRDSRNKRNYSTLAPGFKSPMEYPDAEWSHVFSSKARKLYSHLMMRSISLSMQKILQPATSAARSFTGSQFTLMLNGGPLGAGVRCKLPACCVTGIHQMLPASEAFMGFKAE